MSLPSRGGVNDTDKWYGESYGVEKFFADLDQYEKLVGHEWGIDFDALWEKDDMYGLERFHKEVVLPTLRKAGAADGASKN